MATELQIQNGMKASILGITKYFDAGTAVINEDTFLDESIYRMPAVNILNSDEFISRQDTTTATGSYSTIVLLYIEFTDWKTSQNQFRDVRQAIIDEFNTVGTARSAGGLDGVTINQISSGGPIIGISWNDNDQTLPVYLMQPLVFEVELF